jgi:ribosomal protein S18 acetylase RimI-like enzyme
LEKVAKQNGAIFFAEANGKVVGCIVGVVERQTKDELLECVPTKRGIILELFVDSKHRRKGIGQMLMNKMEDYLQQAGCDIVRVEVFVPNKVAHEFYKKLNYHDRDIDMIKELQGGPTVHN